MFKSYQEDLAEDSHDDTMEDVIIINKQKKRNQKEIKKSLTKIKT
jgi:hypothetical protein